MTDDLQEAAPLEQPEEEKKGMGKGLLIGLMSAAVLLGLAAAVLVQFGLGPMLANKKADDQLSNLKNASGPVTPVNTALVTFQGQKIENANIDQKALGVGDTPTSPAGFIFSNGKTGTKKKVEVYVDFSSQASRDFLLQNKNSLQGMVEGGNIDLYLHPVPTGNAFTMYSAEALAEVFYLQPESAWDVLFELLRMGASVDTDKSGDIVKMIADTTKTLGVKDVNEESIKNGTFASWIISVGNDSRLKTGFYPPLIYVDDKLVDTKTVNVNNPDNFRRVVLG